MSTALFPTLPTLAWSIKRTPSWQTRKIVNMSGKEVVLAEWSYPRYTWEVKYNTLRQGSGLYVSTDTFTEMSTLMGFYNARNGGFDSFLYQDQDDNAVTGQQIAIANGSSTLYQLVRAFGGYVEPIFAPNQVTDVYLNGVPAVGQGAPAAPGAPVLGSIAGGSIAATTYFVKNTYVSALGESVASAETSLAVSANHLLTVQSPSATSGAIGWNTYISTSTGTETRQNTTILPIGTNAVEFATGLIAGVHLPSNAITFNIGLWGATNPGFIGFSSAPGSGVSISADFSFYFPCRFLADQCEFEKWTGLRYKVAKLQFISIKVT